MNFEGYKKFIIIIIISFGWFFLFTRPQVSANYAANFHGRKHVKLYIKTYVFIFCIFFCFLTKYSCIFTYTCEKPPPPSKLS